MSAAPYHVAAAAAERALAAQVLPSQRRPYAARSAYRALRSAYPEYQATKAWMLAKALAFSPFR